MTLYAFVEPEDVLCVNDKPKGREDHGWVNKSLS